MDDSVEIKLSLLDNSHAFLNEAVSYALSAQREARKWQFAVLNLVQSLELSLKALLHEIHLILVFDNVDAPKQTVGPLKALERLNHPLVADTKLSEMESQKIKRAIDLRNQMTHSEFTLRPEYAIAKFFEVLGFVSLFQARHFHRELEEIIGEERLNQLLAVGQGIRELAERAAQRIEEEAIASDLVFDCPNCGNATFVFQDGIDRCYTCRYSEGVRACRGCGRFFFESELHDFSRELGVDRWSDRLSRSYSHGYDSCEACFDCIDRIRDDIAQQQADEEDHWELQRLHAEQTRDRPHDE